MFHKSHSLSTSHLSESLIMKAYLVWTIAAILYQSVGILTASSTPVGYILHRPSLKLIHPLGGSPYPSDNTRLVLYTGGLGETRLQLQFIPAPGQGGYGYIKHVPSGKYVHPLGGSQNPPNDTPLVFYRGYHAACLFKFDLQNDYIIQKTSGKIWHPKGGSATPGNNAPVVLHSDRHSRATFFFADVYGRKISPM